MRTIPILNGHAPRGAACLLAVLWLLAATLPAAAQTTAEDAPPAGRRIKDWTIQCRPAEGANDETCVMVQNVANADGQRLVQILVGRFGAERVLGAIVFVPLGIRLPPGVTLQTDERKPRTFPIERCTTSGCQVDIVLDDALVGAFKAGRIVQVTFQDPRGRSASVEVSLSGFTAALAEVK